jgi:modulator of FtsH protease
MHESVEICAVTHMMLKHTLLQEWYQMDPVVQRRDQVARRSGIVSENAVLRNTWMLLGMTLGFSALVAFISMQMDLPHPGLVITLVGFYGLLFLINKYRNSGVALALTFALTGFMGLTLGPILNMYLSLPGGADLVTMALGMTAFTFVGLSATAVITRKDFSFLAGFLTAGFFVLIGAMIASFFFQSTGLQLMISAGFVLFSSAAILYQTSAIVRGGETNYILATVTLFVSIYNLFLSLLNLLTAFSGND